MLLQMALFHLSWLSNILLYMHYIFFIYSSVSGHYGCFHVLAIIYSAAMNIGVHVPFWVTVFSGKIPRSDNPIFRFLSILIPFSTAVVPTYIPTNSVRGFPSLYTLSSVYYLQTLMVAILAGVRWYLIGVLIGISLIMGDAEHLFTCYLATCVSSWRNVCVGLLPLFWWGCLFFWYCAAGSVYISWRLILFWSLHLKIFSPILCVVFLFCLGFPLLCKNF